MITPTLVANLIFICWTIGVLCVGAYGIYEFVTSYKASTNTGFQRILDGARGSATILWVRFVFIVGMGIDAMAALADFLGAPTVSAAITQYGDPKMVAALMIVIAVVTEFARRRTLPKE